MGNFVFQILINIFGESSMRILKKPSLTYKLYTTFTVSFILPVLLICLFISWLFGSYQYKALKTQNEQTVEVISAYLTKYIQDIDNIMRAPFSHSYLQSNIDVSTLSNIELNQLSSELGATLSMTSYSRDDFGDLLFISGGRVIYFNAENYYQYLPNLVPLTERNWYTAALKKDGKIAFTPRTDNPAIKKTIKTEQFFISRRLKNLHVPEQENIILINMKTNVLDELFSKLNHTHPTIIVFTNDDNEVIYSNTAISKNIVNDFNHNTIYYDHNTWMHSYCSLEKYSLTVHVLFSTTSLYQQIGTYLGIIFLCCLICIVVSYALFFKRKWIRTPVISILSTLKDLEEGNLDARCTELNVLEFNNIASSINRMAHQLQEKIKNEYELTLNQQKLQFEALQSQIRPHFIINTIYGFITLNQIGEKKLLNDYLYSFTHLLRYVLVKENMTTLGNELQFLENYCSLQHLRFGHRMNYSIHCPEEFHSFEIPKLILQPLVENAVVHGIEPSVHPCTLDISVEKHSNSMYIIIEDNGIGFKPEDVNSSSSIGIKNVETRIALWKQNVQLFINRVEGQSIQVIVIPLENEDNYENTNH